MAFDEVRLSTAISFGSSGGSKTDVKIIESANGSEERINRWQNTRRTYDVGFAVKSRQILYDLLAFFEAREGPTRGFRYKDPIDYASTTNGRTDPTAVTNLDQTLGTGDGSKVAFQLVKVYTSGSISKTRAITKPVSGTVVVALNGVNQTSGFTVDTTTGTVTFTAAPSVGVTVTAGFEFDVPVRFDTQDLTAVLQDFDIGDISPSIPLIEIRDELLLSDSKDFGGSEVLSISADYLVAANTATAFYVTATNTGYKFKLPDFTSLQTGGPHFVVVNVGSNAFTVTTSGGTSIVSVTAGTTVEIWLMVDSGGNKFWHAV